MAGAIGNIAEVGTSASTDPATSPAGEVQGSPRCPLKPVRLCCPSDCGEHCSPAVTHMCRLQLSGSKPQLIAGSVCVPLRLRYSGAGQLSSQLWSASVYPPHLCLSALHLPEGSPHGEGTDPAQCPSHQGMEGWISASPASFLCVEGADPAQHLSEA